MSESDYFDLAIIGGGINGCGIARDAAGRGASVVLLEQGDLAAATSSASTKLIHGGLRYLEHYAFRLVREALEEREVLLGIAPHLIEPLRFVLPYQAGMRPAFLIRLGLLLYDHLGGQQSLPPARRVDLKADEAGVPLKDGFGPAFEYSDARVDDARLVILNAKDASLYGARIRPRHRVTGASRGPDFWTLDVTPAQGSAYELRARILVNAAGPWVSDIMTRAGLKDAPRVRLVQGSHIVVPRIFEHGKAYLFQNRDGRVVFAIPYHQDFTLIGTTDRDYDGPLDAVSASETEIAYLCDAANDYFSKRTAPSDVVWSYSGVRALADSGDGKPEDATRDYTLHLDKDGAPLLSVIGGKITTYRRLAEAALELLKPHLPVAAEPDWTDALPLPGGEVGRDGLAILILSLRAKYPFLTAAHAARLARAYGSRAFTMLGDAKRLDQLGPVLGVDLTVREVAYLMKEEWAETAEDILWRRSKLGLRFSAEERERLAAILTQEKVQALEPSLPPRA